MILSEEQKSIIKKLVKVEKPIVTLGGYGGTGKSVIVQHLRYLLQDWAVAAYTGKAAHVLRKKGVSDASTIHKLIYVLERDEHGNPIRDANGQVNFILNPSLAAKGVIIDEASMVSKDIFEDLKSFNIPLIFIGDHGQLEPVGSDIHLMKEPDYKLEKIHRNAGEIAYFSEHVRKGYRPQTFNHGPKVQFISRRGGHEAMTWADQVICAFNQSRVELNDRARKALGYSGDRPMVGEKIVCLRNNQKIGLFNGMQGYVKALPTSFKKRGNNRMIFEADGEEYDLYYDPKQFNKEKYDISGDRGDPDPFDFAYTQTAHKCQGEEYANVLIFRQKCNRWDQKRWDYTTASRAKAFINWAED